MLYMSSYEWALLDNNALHSKETIISLNEVDHYVHLR